MTSPYNWVTSSCISSISRLSSTSQSSAICLLHFAPSQSLCTVDLQHYLQWRRPEPGQGFPEASHHSREAAPAINNLHVWNSIVYWWRTVSKLWYGNKHVTVTAENGTDVSQKSRALYPIQSTVIQRETTGNFGGTRSPNRGKEKSKYPCLIWRNCSLQLCLIGESVTCS